MCCRWWRSAGVKQCEGPGNRGAHAPSRLRTVQPQSHIARRGHPLGAGQLLTAATAAAAAATAAVAGAAAWGSPAAAAYAIGGCARFGVRSRLDQGAFAAPSIALTFDDGPQQHVTERYLDLLAERGVVVTFFVVGEHAVRQRSTIERMIQDGHSVQSHGMRHRDHLLRSPADARRDMIEAAETIAGLTGVRPALYRPPHGVATLGTLRTARRLRQEVVLWTRWAWDWDQRSTSATIVERVLHRLSAGEIVLLHDADHYSGRSWDGTWGAISRILDGVAHAGLETVALTSGVQLAR